MVIFRENTEDIYAGIEFEAGSRGREEGPRLPEGELPRGVQEDPLPGDVGHRHQAGLRRRAPSGSSAPPSSTPSQQAEERHPRPQGQHHEVHRGRLPQLGLRARRARVRATASTPGTQWERTKKAKGEDAANAEQKAALAAREGPHQGRHRRHHAPAGAHPARRVRRHRHAEPERRLPLRRPRRAGRRHRHRPRRQHQLRHRPRHLRGHPRHGAQVREPGQGEPRLGRSSPAR